MNTSQTNKAKFIGKSLIWATLLYGCFFAFINLSDGSNKKIEPVSYTQTSSKQIIPIHISVDSLRKNISVAGNIFHYLSAQLKF